jgi:hypothetical protein
MSITDKQTYLYWSHPSQRTRDSLGWKLCVTASVVENKKYEYLTIC